MLSNRPPMQPFCLNTTSPHRMLLSLASPVQRVVCRCSRRRTLVPPRLWMPGGTALPCSAIGSRALAQTIQPNIHALALVGHSRYPHGISTPTACLPAFALPTATTNKRNAMPGHCMRAEKHLRRTLHTPSSLCTWSYASVPNDVARNRPRRFIVRVFSLLVVYLYTTPYYLSVPAFVLP